MGNLKVISIWEQYSFYYIQGMSATLKIAAVSVLTSILFGIIIGILRLSKNFVLKNIFALYVSFIRRDADADPDLYYLLFPVV